MAITNHERVGKALELLRAGLAPFVEREFRAQHGNVAPVDLAQAAIGPGMAVERGARRCILASR